MRDLNHTYKNLSTWLYNVIVSLISPHSYKPQLTLMETWMYKGIGHWRVMLDPSHHLAYLGFNFYFLVTNGVEHVVVYLQPALSLH